MSVGEKFSIKTNWDQLSHSLEDVLYIRTENSESCSLHNADIEIAYVTLKPGKESQNETCKIVVKSLSDGCQIEAIDVICNAKHLEIYELSGNYLNTSTGIRIDEELGYREKVFILQYSFMNAPASNNGIFLKIPTISVLHVYSIHLTVNQLDPVISPNHPLRSALRDPGIDFEMVKKMIGDVPLSQPAIDLLDKILEKKKLENDSEELSVLLGKLLPLTISSSVTSKSNSQSASGVEPSKTKQQQPVTTNHSMPSTTTDAGLIKSASIPDMMKKLESNLAEYINASICQLENKLMNRLDRIEQILASQMET
ncbi:hypothetical protein HELRODRAFT_161726 [Helobdella robusta]|uniref:Uncharacterized protein n=1 Tax=Helobdella robusta TaxID=6412 RepID=T1ERU3_HELRO|nr:hypothetical protein HELRODRAFT_161726 [Helobdella robusta]ESO02455.1 hypothetical protein HELRODRAFT_161726 [Helobdella robusta]